MLWVVLFRCTHNQNCSIPASTSMFGDPCIGTHKYLEAHYQCLPGKSEFCHNLACLLKSLNIYYYTEVVILYLKKNTRTICSFKGLSFTLLQIPYAILLNMKKYLYCFVLLSYFDLSVFSDNLQ